MTHIVFKIKAEINLRIRLIRITFKYFQINIMTYSFFMLPSMGLGLEASGYQNILGPMYPILGGENGVFLAAWAWKFSLFIFMVFRTALPIVMAKTDKALLSKINVIIRYKIVSLFYQNKLRLRNFDGTTISLSIIYLNKDYVISLFKMFN